MASASDLYSSSAKSSQLPIDWVTGAISESEAAADTGIGQSRIRREFATRTAPDLRNRFASRGTFLSGSTGVQMDRAQEDAANASADMDTMLSRTRNKLQLNRFLAAMGLA